MPKIISDLYIKSEQLKGKKLLFTLIAVFLICIIFGFFAGNLINKMLKKDETSDDYSNNTGSNFQTSPSQLEGKVVYIDPNLNPSEKISYALVDDGGNQIAFLTAVDQKLVVVEGLHVSVYGKMTKTSDNKNDLFIVDKVIVKNK